MGCAVDRKGNNDYRYLYLVVSAARVSAGMQHWVMKERALLCVN